MSTDPALTSSVNRWLLLQLSDSAFPTGGFAHSGGLEAAAQLGEVRSSEDVERYARDWVLQLGLGALPLVHTAHTSPERLAHCDRRADVFLVSAVANRASRTQGRALLETACGVFPRHLGALRDRVRSEGLAQHHAPLFGAVLSTLGVRLEETQLLFLSLQLRGLLSAAVRMNLLGTLEAQRLQHALHPLLEQTLERCGHLELDVHGLAQTAPLQDLLGSVHDRLYSRLFLS